LNPRELAKLDALLEGDYLPFDRFVRGAWSIVDPGVTLRWNWHIDSIIEHLEAATLLQFRNLVINIPPRCMKSRLVAVMWPAWVWTWLPWTRWLFSSYAEDRALQDALDTRRILQSDWYQSNWGHVFQLTGDLNLKSRYQNSEGGLRVSTGVKGKGLGEGGDFIVGDDIHKREEVFSDKVREGTNDWWSRTMSTRGNDPQTAVRVLILQRLHEKDIVGHVEEKATKPGGRQYQKLILPMEYEGEPCITALGNQDPRTEMAELLWPDRFDRDSVDTLRVDLGTYGFGSQCQQHPAPLLGNIYLKHLWHGDLWTCTQQTLPVVFDALGVTVDCSFKETAKGSYVSIQVWGRKGGRRFLLDVRRGRVDIVQTIRWVLDMRAAWPRARLVLVEDKANGPAVISVLEKKLGGLIAYNPKGSKVARAVAFQPDHESGSFILPHPAQQPWVAGFVERFATFPAGVDDEIDAFSQLMDYWLEDEAKDAATESQTIGREALVGILG
jgi:predicted phage terminase large subunit-like protein